MIGNIWTVRMLRKKTLEFLVDWGLGAPPPPPPALLACPITEDTGLAAPQAPGRRRGLTEFLTSPLILQLRVQPTEELIQHTHTCLQIHTREHARFRCNPHIRIRVSDHHGDHQEKASPQSTALPRNARFPFLQPVTCGGKQASSSTFSISLFHQKVRTVLKASS
ncbi:unnamed protein product [Rangifer tarandus platyrhynchus]|uniref:Uncharacterized protein n=1 Tax=Rangifer tarandus platyrhynchus TaxID=3082113 RepID=A0AC59ZHP6_RANTA